MTEKFKIYAAPLQGYTEAAWRRFHAAVSGGADAYFAPFLRLEKGIPRERDLRDLLSPLNEGQNVIPQIIFAGTDEFTMLTDTIRRLGFNRIDLNVGCPHPPQTNHGRGAAVIADLTLLESICKEIGRMPDISFSLKMRLGVNNPDEWASAIDIINGMRLSHVTIHPRTARQLYRGSVNMDAFARIYHACSHPVIFNGDIKSASDIEAHRHDFPDLAGVMIGRGLLGRPCLAAEWRDGHIRSDREVAQQLTDIHNAIYEYAAGRLCGDTQVLSKIRPFWDFSEDIIGHKNLKAIKKTTTTAAYLAAVSAINRVVG